MSKHHETVPATKIMGTHVENWEGENLGTVTDVMVNKMDGDVAYLVLSYPGDYGILWPTKRFAVPFESIAMRTERGSVEYILNVDQAFLEKAPGFDMNDWPDFADQKFCGSIHHYYKDVKLNMVA
jgi:sporulation protein YlmC with PRC-barrel domain